MKTTAKIFFPLFITTMFFSCRKDKPIPQQPCLGGCGTIDFNVIDYQPAWSPNGKYIAYYHSDSVISKNGIYLITPDGKENRLWHSAVGAETPTWSPDGQWIAFSMGAQIWKKKLNSDSLSQLTNIGRNFFPAWSPDGEWIAYHRSYSFPELETVQGIWKMNTNGINKIQVFKGNSGYPSWSDLNNIIFIRGVVNFKGEVLGDSLKIYLNNERRISNVFFIEGSNSYPKHNVSNGKKILLTSQKNILPQIWVMDANGSNKKQLTQTGGYTSDWSNDGVKIVYTDTRSVNGRLWIMNTDGSNKKQLTYNTLK